MSTRHLGSTFQPSLPDRRTGATPAPVDHTARQRSWPGFRDGQASQWSAEPSQGRGTNAETQWQKYLIHDCHDGHDDRRRPHAARSCDQSSKASATRLSSRASRRGSRRVHHCAMFGEASTEPGPARIGAPVVWQPTLVERRQSARVGSESAEGKEEGWATQRGAFPGGATPVHDFALASSTASMAASTALWAPAQHPVLTFSLNPRCSTCAGVKIALAWRRVRFRRVPRSRFLPIKLRPVSPRRRAANCPLPDL